MQGDNADVFRLALIFRRVLAGTSVLPAPHTRQHASLHDSVFFASFSFFFHLPSPVV